MIKGGYLFLLEFVPPWLFRGAALIRDAAFIRNAALIRGFTLFSISYGFDLIYFAVLCSATLTGNKDSSQYHQKKPENKKSAVLVSHATKSITKPLLLTVHQHIPYDAR